MFGVPDHRIYWKCLYLIYMMLYARIADQFHNIRVWLDYIELVSGDALTSLHMRFQHGTCASNRDRIPSFTATGYCDLIRQERMWFP